MVKGRIELHRNVSTLLVVDRHTSCVNAVSTKHNPQYRELGLYSQCPNASIHCCLIPT